MRDLMIRRKIVTVILACSVVAVILAIAGSQAGAMPKPTSSKTEVLGMPPSAGVISGAVTSSKGPEAGVWVIAETLDLGTKYR